MNYEEFEGWLKKLSAADRKYLEKHSSWRKLHEEVLRKRSLPNDFVETTMEILEGGSESET
jgi:hypothetical protein